MKIKFLILLPLVCLLQSCSWQEYFVITNETNADIIIEYEIEMPPSGFSIFNNNPLSYKLNSDGDIYWNETNKAIDLDTARLSIKIILPPNNGLIIGILSNDHYTNYNQYFINGRHFNLKKLKIQNAKTEIEINTLNFDSHFKKQKSLIEYRVK